MTSVIFNSCLEKHFAGEILFPSDKFKVMLVTASYAPKKNIHSTRADVSGDEINGISYDKGGSAVRVAVERKDNTIEVILGGAAWQSSTIVARGAVYYKDNGSPELDDLVAYIDFNGTVISTNGPFRLAESILRFQN